MESPRLIETKESGHWYYVPEVHETWASVTTKLKILRKPFLETWKVNQALKVVEDYLYVHDKPSLLSDSVIKEMLQKAKGRSEEILDDAATIGSKAHRLADRYLSQWIKQKKKPLPALDLWIAEKDDARLSSCFRALLQWIEEFDYVPVSSEIIAYSRTHKEIGTIDNIGLLQKRKALALIDFKSSNGIWEDYYLQVAAYWGIYKEFSGKTPQEAWIVRFGKWDGTFEARQVKYLPELWEYYLAVSQAWEGMRFVENIRTEKKSIIL